MTQAQPIDEDRDVAGAVQLLGGKTTFAAVPHTRFAVHRAVIDGLPSAAVRTLSAKVRRISRQDVMDAIGISDRTLQRKKEGGADLRLSREQSDRAWKFSHVLAKATEVFGSQDQAEEFLAKPAMGLNQQVPIDLLQTSSGHELVEEYLDRVRYGVYA